MKFAILSFLPCDPKFFFKNPQIDSLYQITEIRIGARKKKKTFGRKGKKILSISIYIKKQTKERVEVKGVKGSKGERLQLNECIACLMMMMMMIMMIMVMMVMRT